MGIEIKKGLLVLDGNEPPYKVDPRLAISNVENLPLLIQRGIYSVFMRSKGSTLERYVFATNVIVKTLTEAKPPRLKRGTMRLTDEGRDQEELRKKKEHNRENAKRVKAVLKWAKEIIRNDGEALGLNG